MSEPADETRLFKDDSTPATNWCPRCGYALVGLSSHGNCPECGYAYDDSTIILYGTGRGSHERIETAKSGRAVWITIAGCLVLIPQFLNPQTRTNSPFLIVFAALIVVPRLILFTKRYSSQHPGLVQVRLSKWGCIQHDDLTGPSMWKDLSPFLIILLMPAWLLYCGRWWGSNVPFYISLAIIPLSVFFLFRRRSAYRRVSPGAESLVDDWHSGSPRPWSSLRDVVVGELGGGRCVIRARNSNSFWKLRVEPVHAEFQATPFDLQNLRDTLASWRFPQSKVVEDTASVSDGRMPATKA